MIIIIIAAIAYFGILKPQKILPDRCNFNAGFDCQAYTLINGPAANDDIVRLRLKNGLGSTIDIDAAPAGQLSILSEAGSVITCTAAQALPITNWGTGEVKDLAWTGCDLAALGFSTGEKAKIFVKIKFYDPKAGSDYTKIAEGEFFTTVT